MGVEPGRQALGRVRPGALDPPPIRDRDRALRLPADRRVSDRTWPSTQYVDPSVDRLAIDLCVGPGRPYGRIRALRRFVTRGGSDAAHNIFRNRVPLWTLKFDPAPRPRKSGKPLPRSGTISDVRQRTRTKP